MYYSKTDTSEAIDVNKRKTSTQFMVCHFSYLINFTKVTDKFCYGCYNTLLILQLKILKGLIIEALFGGDKQEEINLMNSSVLDDDRSL